MSGILPKALAERPMALLSCKEYLAAFTALDGSRVNGVDGMQPITITEILSYCTLAGVAPGEPAQKLLRLIQRVDHARLNHWHKKNTSAK